NKISKHCVKGRRSAKRIVRQAKHVTGSLEYQEEIGSCESMHMFAHKLVTHAQHLKLVTSMMMKQFLLALFRCVAKCEYLLSDLFNDNELPENSNILTVYWINVNGKRIVEECANLEEDELHAVFCNIKALINSRYFTFI
ncbi:hypothetical protein T4A_3747, partial [Trichinella pseudospiralis]